jgi:hypothetical protein
MIAKLMHPEIVKMTLGVVEATRPDHGKGTLGGRVGSGEAALISSFVSCATNYLGRG